jgi:signal transduction histidine kinase
MHFVDVAASLDGASWSSGTARLALRVSPPWYLQAWFLALSATVVAGAVYGVHRVRVASLMRLERQRARIAMDLHDEMGSGLGSIGILAGLAAGNRLDEDRRRDVSDQIARTAGELGAALDEIVWSLRRESGSLESLAAELSARGRRLFPDGREAFSTIFPQRWPDVRLEPAVRRNLQRIAVEAMHNAARHARARSVTLAIEPAGRRWRLRVEDDGEGLSAGVEGTGNGLGLRGIRERAGQIGAAVEWRTPPGGGTELTVEFDPHADAVVPEP